MSESNGHKCQPVSLQWKVGLLNSNGKYLTAEKFGGKTNVSGTSMKNKQIWVLEQDLQKDLIYLRSHAGKYLTFAKGKDVCCEAEEQVESAQYSLQYKAEKCILTHAMEKLYLGGNENSAKCDSTPETWTIQLCIHPHVHLFNVNRKRYAHVSDDEIHFSENIPWGKESLLFLEFKNGKYAFKSYDNRYLNKDGKLQETSLEEDSKSKDDFLFTLEIKSGQHSGLAFKDNDERYLTVASGQTGTARGKSKTFTKDELFTIEDSHPQVVITADNGKKASVKQGIDVSAKQEEVSDTEIFQMEYDKDKDSGAWYFRTCANKYWTLDSSTSGIQANSTSKKDSCKFFLEWQGDGTVAIKASNNCYVFNKPNGTLAATAESIGNTEKFKIKIVNRPPLVLRAEYGFVGVKSKSEECCCNKVSYELIDVEGLEDGTYSIKGSNGKYWSVAGNGIVMADGDGPTKFVIEFQGMSMLSIKAPNGLYLQGEQNGLIKASGTEINSQTRWEF